ncbi:MAG: amidohydrolase family protein [Gemmataceae bacterium]
MLTLIENGEIYAPEPKGRLSVLLSGNKILKTGPVDRRALDRLVVDYEVIDAADRLVVPGVIDPHEHLVGGTGEKGFGSKTPEIFLAEIVSAGITTVVGTLGVDSTTTNMVGLLAKVKALRQQGMGAYLYTGGYNVPPSTITTSVRDDILLIDEVIGAGEIAISDVRSTDPSPHELAKLVNDAYVGGIISGKAGITHFHVGEKKKRLALLRTVLDDFDAEAGSLYPTHVERTEPLMKEALELVQRGCTVDIDVVNKDLPKWMKYYFNHDGNPAQLTVSSDSFLTGPHNLFEQIRACVLDYKFPLEQVLPLVTANTARILKLNSKGRLKEKMDADVLVLERDSLAIVEVIAGGTRMVRDGQLAVAEGFLEGSDRTIEMSGKKALENVSG